MRHPMPALNFDNRFVRELPADPSQEPGRRQVHGALYSRVHPTPVAAPRLVAWSRECADLLGLAEADVTSPAFAEAMAGNVLVPGSEPFAANYGGHQFGHWAGQLGDGRAITLGEAINAGGQRLELQLKGAGPTPYSRSADGRAVLRSSVREFLVSEAMHHLGVPTTRALCLVATGEDVIRDMFYDGRPRAEPGAIVCRVAPSFIRFGNFELPASRGDVALLARLVEFTIRRDFPELVADGQPVDAALRARWFAEVCERTAVMVAHWMRVGFVHGVMNTDNMSILGLTIDYGPYGWIDDFDLDWTPNTTDAEGRRYRFGHQAQIAYWNLTRLASALVPLFDDHDPLHEGLARYEAVYVDTFREHAAAKLGLFNDYELLYPRPFDAEVRRGAELTGLPPALIYAIIRQESLYRADAASSANALGLMQLLPSTAQTTARRAGLPKPTRASLLQPSVNVPLGSSFLRYLLDRARHHKAAD